MTKAWAVIGLSVLLGASAFAEPPKEQARRHFRNGMTQFTLDHFDDAVKEFEAAYAAVPDPAFLANIAQCHRLAKRGPQAIAFYQKYLRLAPTAPNRNEIQGYIQQLQKLPTQIVASNGPTVPAPSNPAVVLPPVAAVPAEKPKNVRSEDLDAQVINKPDPHLPEAVKARLQGNGDVTFSAKVCVEKTGKVFFVQVLHGIPGADEDLVATIRQWSYQPQTIPVCFLANWVFSID